MTIFLATVLAVTLLASALLKLRTGLDAFSTYLYPLFGRLSIWLAALTVLSELMMVVGLLVATELTAKLVVAPFIVIATIVAGVRTVVSGDVVFSCQCFGAGEAKSHSDSFTTESILLISKESLRLPIFAVRNSLILLAALLISPTTADYYLASLIPATSLVIILLIGIGVEKRRNNSPEFIRLKSSKLELADLLALDWIRGDTVSSRNKEDSRVSAA